MITLNAEPCHGSRDRLLLLLERQIRDIAAALDADNVQSGLRSPDWRILTWLGIESGVSLKRLAGNAGMTASSASRRLQHLASLGWVEFSQVPGNRRTYSISITEAGRQVHERAKRTRAKEAQVALDALADDELHQTTRILAKCLDLQPVSTGC